MRIILSLLLILQLNFGWAQKDINDKQYSINKSLLGWYKVVESNNSNIWAVNNTIFISAINKDNSIQITGYTNQGAIVEASIINKQFLIPQQTVTIKPYGGDGKAQWNVNVEAKGKLKKGILKLSFYFKQDSFQEYKGEITAIKLPGQDTTINNVFYEWLKYDLNINPYEIGESNKDGIKNGNWLYHNQQQRLSADVNYINDTLNGWAKFYYYHNMPEILMFEGLIIRGKKAGLWYTKIRETRFSCWHTASIILYNNNEQIISRTLTYENGKPKIEIFYNETGKEIWYRYYNKNGKITKDDNKKPLIYDLLIEDIML